MKGYVFFNAGIYAKSNWIVYKDAKTRVDIAKAVLVSLFLEITYGKTVS